MPDKDPAAEDIEVSLRRRDPFWAWLEGNGPQRMYTADEMHLMKLAWRAGREYESERAGNVL